ncbi:MAG: hypothetical protein AAGL23_05935 [Pseudomonadota bacterium]
MAANRTEIDHLVLCVHGIGNQVAGDTVDDVLSGAVAEHYRTGGAPVIADDAIVNLFEPAFEDYSGLSVDRPRPFPGGKGATVLTPIHNGRKDAKEEDADPQDEDREEDTALHQGVPPRKGTATMFPMHIKRVRPQTAPASQVKTVLAEVYWADLSAEPKGAFATIFDLVKVVMSIGYLALDNAANTYARAGYWAIVCFLWALIAGVVALNAGLLMGVVVLLLEGWVFNFQGGHPVGGFIPLDQRILEGAIAGFAGLALVMGALGCLRVTKINWWPFFAGAMAGLVPLGIYGLFNLQTAEAVIVATGTATTLLGVFFGATRWNLSLWRMFGVGTGGCGLLVLAFVPFIAETGSPGLMLADTFKDICPKGFACEKAQLVSFIGTLMLLLEIAWAIAVFLCIIVYVVWAVGGKASLFFPTGQPQHMYAPVCSALMLLWMVVASSFWVFIQHSLGDGPERITLLPQALETAIKPLVLNMAIGVLFLLILLVVAVGLVVGRFMIRDVLFKTAITAPWIGRLLLNGMFQVVFAISTLVFVTIVAELGAMKAVGISPFHIVSDYLGLGWVDETGLTKSHKLQDILPYVPYFLLGLALFVYRFREKIAGGLGAFRDIVVYANNDAFDPSMEEGKDLSNFPPREQIEGRFERVSTFLMTQVKPKKVTVIAHSQGTVVATRNLRRLLPSGLFEGCEVTLVTMGSPVTHLYRKYFPRAFRVDKGDFDNNGGPITWYNIGRTDDFVGTYIEGLDELNGLDPAPQIVPSERNLLVPAGGHPGYFTDPYVWEHFTQKIKFKLL